MSNLENYGIFILLVISGKIDAQAVLGGRRAYANGVAKPLPKKRIICITLADSGSP